MLFWSLLAAFTLCTMAAAAQDSTAQDSTAQAAADSLVWMDDDLWDAMKNDPLRREANEGTGAKGRFPIQRIPQFFSPFPAPNFLAQQDAFQFISYDRADGVYLGLGGDLPAKQFRKERTQGYFGFGYGFGSHYWQVYGGVAKDWGLREAPTRLRLEGHVITDTRDAWKMPASENSLHSLLAGIDTRDYFNRNGFSASLQQFLSPRLGLQAEYRWDNYRSLQREAGWSLIGPEQPFAENPPVRNGVMATLAFRLLADYTTWRTWGDPQIGVESEFEIGVGESDFQLLVVDARVKGTLVENYLFAAGRVRIGSASGNAPPQRTFTIGGIGTVPGYPQNHYAGNRMILLQTDLLVGIAPWLRLIVENNIAAVSAAPAESGLLSDFPGEVAAFKFSPGIYLGSPTGSFRIGASWRTDVFEAPEFVVRLSQPM